jgi:hypothetical protein
MQRCKICGVFGCYKDKYCPYCGYRFNPLKNYTKEDLENNYRLDSNNGKGKNYEGTKLINYYKRVGNSSAYKKTKIDKTIDNEIKKINTIENALKNINENKTKDALELLIEKFKYLTFSLIICSLNYDFLKYLLNFEAIYEVIGTLTSENIIYFISCEEESYKNWKSIITIKYSGMPISKYINETDNRFNDLKEKCSLTLIGSILKSTSLIRENIINYQKINEIGDNEINNILYEIDRLNSEIEIL